MPVELSSREAFKSLVAILTGKGLDWVVEPILPDVTGRRAFAALPKHDGNKQYDLRYDLLGSRDEP